MQRDDRAGWGQSHLFFIYITRLALSVIIYIPLCFPLIPSSSLISKNIKRKKYGESISFLSMEDSVPLPFTFRRNFGVFIFSVTEAGVGLYAISRNYRAILPCGEDDVSVGYAVAILHPDHHYHHFIHHNSYRPAERGTTAKAKNIFRSRKAL